MTMLSIHQHPSVYPHQMLANGPAHSVGECAACGRVAHDTVTCMKCIAWERARGIPKPSIPEIRAQLAAALAALKTLRLALNDEVRVALENTVAQAALCASKTGASEAQVEWLRKEVAYEARAGYLAISNAQTAIDAVLAETKP